jgi:hypothetical protein
MKWGVLLFFLFLLHSQTIEAEGERRSFSSEFLLQFLALQSILPHITSRNWLDVSLWEPGVKTKGKRGSGRETVVVTDGKVEGGYRRKDKGLSDRQHGWTC